MQNSHIVLAGAMAMLLAAPASAAQRGDFAGLAICSKLLALPKAYKATECNRRAPLRGECRFTLSSNGMPIEYLMEDGVVLAKDVKLAAGARFAAPYGLSHGESRQGAARKIRATTGLSSQHWEDSEEPGTSYLQSDSVQCGASKAYTIYVWFRDGRAKSVSVSTLPAF